MMSFYQHYRPKKISELDLASVRGAMEAVMTSGKPSHAYLFVGSRGLGKTSTARILAKLVNCEKNKSGDKWGEPCGVCAMCRGIDSGSAVDVVEIDAASNTGVDNIRELREKIGLAPVEASVKVFIMDEVHMLSTAAFNALLKTLEEPPKGVMFILCTTEEEKVPKTIASRCVRVVFRKPSKEEIVMSLKKVIVGESLEMGDDALCLLVDSVDGSFREGHKLLEQLAQVEKKISLEAVRSVVSGSGEADVDKLLMVILERDAERGLACIEDMGKRGVSWISVVKTMVEKLRLELRAYVGIGARQYGQVDVGVIRQILGELMMMPFQMKQAVDEQLPLELMVAEYIREDKSGKDKSGKDKSDESRKSVAEIISREDKSGKDKSDESTVDMGMVNQKWQEVLSTLAPKNHSVAGLLRATKPKAIEGRYLILEVFYKFHKEQLEQDLKRRMLEEVLAEKVGPLSVKCVLGERAEVKLVSAEEVQMATTVADIFGVKAS